MLYYIIYILHIINKYLIYNFTKGEALKPFNPPPPPSLIHFSARTVQHYILLSMPRHYAVTRIRSDGGLYNNNDNNNNNDNTL